MQGNAWRPGPRTPLGELTALPQTPWLVVRGLAAPSSPFSKNPSPLSALRASPVLAP